MYIYKYTESQIIILHQHVSITPATIIRMFYNKNAINTQIIVQIFMTKPMVLSHVFVPH